MAIEPGTVLAHYEIIQPLGNGGLGEVYRAKDRNSVTNRHPEFGWERKSFVAARFDFSYTSMPWSSDNLTTRQPDNGFSAILPNP